jgi:hypothetical protein
MIATAAGGTAGSVWRLGTGEDGFRERRSTAFGRFMRSVHCGGGVTIMLYGSTN